MGTVLADQLADPAGRRPTAVDAFRIARTRFLASERIDMGPLANEVGVSRMTLNRWVGSRDLLLAEIVWSITKPALDAACASAPVAGPQRVVNVVDTLTHAAVETSFMYAFITQEREIALRILTTTRTPFQSRLRDYLRDLIVTEIPAEQRPLDADSLAYIITRIAESFVYVDLITGGAPDPNSAGLAVAALLGTRND